jgi:hypothetical protein
MEMKYDEEVISYFIRKEKQERYRYMLMRPKHRRHAIMELHDLSPIKPPCLIPLPSKIPDIYNLASLLRSKGAGENAYVISGITEIDGRVLPLLEALDKCVSYAMPTIVYCFKGKVGYCEGDCVGFFLLRQA